MFLDHRVHRGATEFRFRPTMLSKERMSRVQISSLDKTFAAAIWTRNRTTDARVFSQIFLDCQYNLRRFSRFREIYQFYQYLTSIGTPLILDGGANIGLSSLYFCKNWPHANIIAVEPDRANCEMFERNVGGRTNVKLVQGALASSSGMARITNPAAEAWEYRVEIVNDGEIPAVAINDLITSDMLPFIAKIDIEGAENELFSANTEWIDSFPIIIVELHDWMLPTQGSSRSFLRAIAERPRDFCYFGENIFSIANDLDSCVRSRHLPVSRLSELVVG